jgi:trans-L-3-hydroxyproline dehydratase
MAIHKARKEIDYGETMTIESIIGSVFKGSVISEQDYGPFKAVIPQVEGTAYITGMQTFVIDPNDPMKNGFIFR